MDNNIINRGEFIKGLGMSAKALMAFYCIGAISACEKTEETAVKPVVTTPPVTTPPVTTTPPANTGVTGTTTGATINFSLDFSNKDFSKLLTMGEFVIVGDVLVANANGTYIALSKACTHEGTTVDFRSKEGDIRCSNHDSQFTIDGSVKKGPAVKSLVAYKASFDAATKILKVS
jgi:cytochrome b6-f complex iron-sulfur subunit